MWISELSERTRIPVDTIKHYLRVGVLPKGRSVGPMRAEYDEAHVARLRLVKALTEVGQLKLDQVRRILESADGPDVRVPQAVGAAHYELSRRVMEERTPSPEALAAVEAMIGRRGWQVGTASPHREALAVALDALLETGAGADRPGRGLTDLLDLYSEHLGAVAEAEIGFVDLSDPERALLNAISTTVLSEPVVLVVRRLAQEHAVRDRTRIDPPPEGSPHRRWTDG
ncbi:MerR family transcriptional regulator [Nocardioides mangrovicus]|uniref:MerR family transcriptional regulator n=1 Tax=Nocardioides mangrovicus TaxID=2478913 RepID=A0A3L8P836_9ACTN|nr:MerR family transcriptional regulator [Nocardioides mangrovicus]RLV51142.1 MerR family transcriptional regulator [Nocardioides mangrovicus]